MSSNPDLVDAPATDRQAETDCDRCNDPLAPNDWIRVSANPTAHLANHYDTTTRRWCPDCAAAVGLLAFTADHAPPRLDGLD